MGDNVRKLVIGLLNFGVVKRCFATSTNSTLLITAQALSSNLAYSIKDKIHPCTFVGLSLASEYVDMFYSCTCLVSIVLISTYIVLMVATFREIWPLGERIRGKRQGISWEYRSNKTQDSTILQMTYVSVA